MSSLKEQRDKIFQEKLQELGDMGTKERTLEDAPFYDKPVTSLSLPQEKKEEEIISESTSTISFSQYADLYLTVNSSKGAKSGFTIRTEVLQTLRHVLSDLRSDTTLSSYIERIIVEHLRTHQQLLNKEIVKRKKEQTIQL
ncbi:DUF3408 domain-containing protein [Hoylesella pleuritidis]|uniref:Conjugative transposon protein, TraC family n=1 Tax=Hoylesella pleuritidis F0068 TaxID=1081904 RepID=U2LCE5_9BACT|nr:DUF3408 domain-containing protein [Hoylesella pleuritidis]ERK02163.1 conjugative transposon protein, TraC family [Hoylesella pleuritidis F0068]